VPDYEGCPEFSEEIIEELDEISQLIYFKTNSYILNENDKKIIDRVYEILKKHSYLKVKILGHTDAQGEEEYNIKLSESRAQSVTEYLLFRGISSDRIHSKGYGENSPVESNSSEQGRALNRRVEFVIIKN
jgi:outer membrane protein OmpA-like peptidoglycan-associated protein